MSHSPHRPEFAPPYYEPPLCVVFFNQRPLTGAILHSGYQISCHIKRPVCDKSLATLYSPHPSVYHVHDRDIWYVLIMCLVDLENTSSGSS
jgi:hypothetical protein